MAAWRATTWAWLSAENVPRVTSVAAVEVMATVWPSSLTLGAASWALMSSPKGLVPAAMAGMPAGGFIVLGVLCAVWRALAQKRKAYLTKEARNLVDVHSQKEADREQ